MDISYIPMSRGLIYLCAVVDWFSRKVLSWRLSITMEADFCIEAVEKALALYGKPEIWRSIKYEEVYLHAYKSVSEAALASGTI